jgi:hypothetical protein
MQYRRGNLPTLELADEAGTYLSGHWTAVREPRLRHARRDRVRSVIWNIAAGVLMVSSLGVYVCGLIFLVRLV